MRKLNKKKLIVSIIEVNFLIKWTINANKFFMDLVHWPIIESLLQVSIISIFW